MAELTGYELSRDWFDFCFENPEKVTPTHTALYFFSIEHCNRLGWKEKFGIPTNMAMDAIGVKNWRTYSKAFNDIVEWGFWQLIEKSKNQYSATVIAIVKNTKANTKALTKAIQKHVQKQSSSIVVIDKLFNIEQETIEPIKHFSYDEFIIMFNAIKNSKFTNKDSKGRRQFNERIKEGRTQDEFEVAIINCKNSEHHIKYPQYLTPEFITRSDKLEFYLNCKNNGQTTGTPAKNQDRFNVGEQDYSRKSF